MKRKLILIVTVVLTTLTTWSLRAGVNPHMVEVDLDIDYLAADDPAEWTPGGFVCVEGRRKITLQKVQPADWGTTAGDSTKRVRLSWGSTKIAIYDAATGGNAVISGTDYANANLPTNFWVEGVAVSATAGTSSTPGPETILAQAIPDGMYDRISFTVYQVDSITVTPKGVPADYQLPTPVKIAAGAIASDAHQADVVIQVLPGVAGIPIDISLLDGRSHQSGKAAKLVMGSVTAQGGGGVVTAVTGTGGKIEGVLTSSDVYDSCTIHTGTKESQVLFTWNDLDDEEKYTDTDADGEYTAEEPYTDTDGNGEWTGADWTSETPYLVIPGTSLETLRLRHNRGTTNDVNWKPLNGHNIRFYVEEVRYVDANGGVVTLLNKPSAPPICVHGPVLPMR
jgi:hypothetical protein